MTVYLPLEHLLCIMRYDGLAGIITMRSIAKMNSKEWIKKCEGFRSRPYLDTAGKLTVGFGHNLEEDMSIVVANFIFEEDYKKHEAELMLCDWYLIQPDGVKSALINMCFNMGMPRLKGFKRMIAALKERNYTVAAKEALDSKWAKEDVGQRAKDVALMIRGGK